MIVVAILSLIAAKDLPTLIWLNPCQLFISSHFESNSSHFAVPQSSEESNQRYSTLWPPSRATFASGGAIFDNGMTCCNLWEECESHSQRLLTRNSQILWGRPKRMLRVEQEKLHKSRLRLYGSSLWSVYLCISDPRKETRVMWKTVSKTALDKISFQTAERGT